MDCLLVASRKQRPEQPRGGCSKATCQRHSATLLAPRTIIIAVIVVRGAQGDQSAAYPPSFSVVSCKRASERSKERASECESERVCLNDGISFGRRRRRRRACSLRTRPLFLRAIKRLEAAKWSVYGKWKRCQMAAPNSRQTAATAAAAEQPRFGANKNKWNGNCVQVFFPFFSRARLVSSL